MIDIDGSLIDRACTLKVALLLLERGVLKPGTDRILAHAQPILKVLALLETVNGKLLRTADSIRNVRTVTRPAQRVKTHTWPAYLGVGDLLCRCRIVLIFLPLSRLAEDLLRGDLHRRGLLIFHLCLSAVSHLD